MARCFSQAYPEALKIQLDKDTLLSSCQIPFEELKRLNVKEEIEIDFLKISLYNQSMIKFSECISCHVFDSWQGKW